MPCVSADGTLTKLAAAMLGALRQPATAPEIAAAVGFPLYRVRSGLRELAEAGLVTEMGGTYQLTEAGTARVGPKE